MHRRAFLTFGALLAANVTALAQHRHGNHSHSHEGKNGGRVVDASDFHVELVIKGDAIDIYVSDHDEKPLSVAGYKGVAIFVLAGKSQRVPLEPVEDKRLSGKASAALPAKFKGAIQITPPGKKAFTAKFD
jgi:hypothetical protein